ncbi:hypothetical protein HZB88_05555 [archaeon]|nr:hypothetical protein [archaeon]
MDYQKGVLELSNRMRVVSIDKNTVYLQARYGPSPIVKIPLKISEDLSCFVAIVIGDGHLKKNKFVTSIEVSNRKLLVILSKIIFKLFSIRTVIKKVKKRMGKKQTYHLTIYSKAVQELLNIIFGIPRGKKSSIVNIPRPILLENKNIQSSFMVGLLVTEGSKKGRRRVRISTSSKVLTMGIQKVLNNFGIPSFIER